METTKDIWDIIKILGTLTSSILIPVTIFIVGHLFKKQKEKSDKEAREIDKISQFLQHLTSENENERIVALKLAKYLRKKNQLPEELISAVETLSIADGVSGALATDVLQDKEDTEEQMWLELQGLIVRSKKALSAYWKSHKTYGPVREIADVNTRARNLFLIHNLKIPLELRQWANMLVRHYNDWLSGYHKYLGTLETDPKDEDKCNYLAAPNYLYPHKAEENLLKYIQEKYPE